MVPPGRRPRNTLLRILTLVVSHLLLASSDRVRPRTALMRQMGSVLVSDALQLVPGMPWQARFGLLAIPYAVNAMFGGSRWVLVREIVPEGSYILARSLMNLADGGMQVVGYGVGGLASLFIPYGNAASAGHGSLTGWLFMSTAAGMMAGDLAWDAAVAGQVLP